MKLSPEGGSSAARLAVGVGAGAMAISGLVYLDGRAGRKRWPPPELELVDLPRDATSATIVFHGLGSNDAAQQAQHAQEVFQGHVAHWVYPHKVTAAMLAERLVQQAPDIKLLNGVNQSMGHPLCIETARIAQQTGLPDLRLGTLVACDSPYDVSDGFFGSAAWLLGAVKWPTGPGHKFTFQFARGLLEGMPLLAAYHQARRDAHSPGAPDLWIGMGHYMANTKLGRHVDEYRQLIGPDTEACYFQSDDSRSIRPQASASYAALYEELGVPYRVLRLPTTRHGDMAQACLQYAVERASQTPSMAVA